MSDFLKKGEVRLAGGSFYCEDFSILKIAEVKAILEKVHQTLWDELGSIEERELEAKTKSHKKTSLNGRSLASEIS